jgi:hypothetical protein
MQVHDKAIEIIGLLNVHSFLCDQLLDAFS